MPLIASAPSESRNYTPAPEGVHLAVCVDIIDLGKIESKFTNDDGTPKLQHKVNVVWQIEDLRDDGKRFQLYKRYTLSLHEKAALRHDLESWRGQAFTTAELAGFDVENVIGKSCLVNVQHRKSEDGTKTYANVISIMPPVKGMTSLAPLDYARPDATKETVDESSEIPF